MFEDPDLSEDGNEELLENGKDNNSETSTATRTVTLQMLLDEGILKPGKAVMTIEYLGQTFYGDLLENGTIRSYDTELRFSSPSAWAVACKRFLKPENKSGCGWGSVKYNGRKLDVYKNAWYKIKSGELKKEDIEILTNQEENKDDLRNMANLPVQRVVVKHNTIANRTFTHDANTMVECVPFSNLGKIQPFLITLSTNAALLIDLQCHLTKSEVCGYLAGHWDVNAHNLQVTHAYPCRNTKADRENGQQVELEISKTIERKKLTLVGWYHSHPFNPAAPTLRDIDAQLDYQIRMKGPSDNNYTPCIGIIVSPYNYETTSLESNIISYWVIPPPEAKPNEYGRPMLMSYNVSQDSGPSKTVKEEIKKCIDYYKKEPDFINFSDKYFSTTTFGDKLRASLTSKFPRDQGDPTMWAHIRDLLELPNDDKDNLLSIPSVSKSSQMMMNLNAPINLNSNLMLTSDIANVLFNSGKFPSATSLLGLPDPMAHSTLAANNMFLQSNLFKMQDLLRPLSTSSPIPTAKSKSDFKMSSPLKIPTDVKSSSKIDYPTDLNILALKNKLDFSSDLSLGKSSKPEFSLAELSNLSSNLMSMSKDFSIADLSISSIKNPKFDYSVNLSKLSSDCLERPSKIPKTDYSLDLSQKNFLSSFPNIPSDLSVTAASDDLLSGTSNDLKNEQPLNLHSDNA